MSYQQRIHDHLHSTPVNIKTTNYISNSHQWQNQQQTLLSLFRHHTVRSGTLQQANHILLWKLVLMSPFSSLRTIPRMSRHIGRYSTIHLYVPSLSRLLFHTFLSTLNSGKYLCLSLCSFIYRQTSLRILKQGS
jgi:hypothetical protein